MSDAREIAEGLVVMDSAGTMHRFPTAKSHRTTNIGTHLQTSIHALTYGLGDPMAVFNDAIWIAHAAQVQIESIEKDSPHDQ